MKVRGIQIRSANKAVIAREEDASKKKVMEDSRRNDRKKAEDILAKLHAPDDAPPAMLEDESAEWAERTGGSIIELHLYANEEMARMDEDRLWGRLAPTVDELLPGLGAARVLGAGL